MNKTELIAAVAEKTGLSKKDSDAAVNAVLCAITIPTCSARLTRTRRNPCW